MNKRNPEVSSPKSASMGTQRGVLLNVTGIQPRHLDAQSPRKGAKIDPDPGMDVGERKTL